MNRLTLPAAWRRHLPTDVLTWLYAAFVGLLLVCGSIALLTKDSGWWLVPFVAPAVVALFYDWRWAYYLLLFSLAFSHEINLPNGLSTDIPSEPLMLVVTGCCLAGLITGAIRLPRRLLGHPLVLLVFLAWLWAATSTLVSVDTLKSVKYLLAKTWYLIPFGMVTWLVVRRPAHVWRVAGCYTAGVALSTLYSVLRHAGSGFRFDTIHQAVQPFYRNHVIYAATLALLIPYTWYAARAAHTRWGRRLWLGAFWLFLFGVFTSYTRASILAVVLSGVFYYIIRWRLTRLLLIGSALATLLAVVYFVQQNKYLLYAPDYEKTVFYGDNFEKHLEATYKLEDVSGMERLYRWVAAARMFHDKPITGTGPSTFYPEYKHYTVKSFRTYVSDNPERSTTHNYFLLLLAEQGLPGLLLFAFLLSTALLLIERLYHQSKDPVLRNVVLAAGLSFYIIVFHLLLNELVEVDKIGSFFFIALVILIRVQEWVYQPETRLTADDSSSPG
ncbi:O-antigen ligase family protein [Hymenobacter sp. DG25B]|uniref:O-antigen ligase family protein n=1 Tax=Hymenobacter sp. DG25B TaxID=1385664 RepID=UPI0006620749|nr:O-antigen ligase family protein [Hymenobacter sp. DG25B]